MSDKKRLVEVLEVKFKDYIASIIIMFIFILLLIFILIFYWTNIQIRNLCVVLLVVLSAHIGFIVLDFHKTKKRNKELLDILLNICEGLEQSDET